MKIKKMNYQVYHRAFGVKTRGEYRALYDNVLLLSKEVSESKTRNSQQNRLLQYLWGRQYDNLDSWDKDFANPLKPEKRAPKIVVPTAKYHCQTIAAQMFGEGNTPRIYVEDIVGDGSSDEDKKITDQINAAVNDFQIFSGLQDVMYFLSACGSAFIHVFTLNGRCFYRVFTPDVCYPYFNDVGDLLAISIQYVFTDPLDNEDKWFRMELTQQSTRYFNNPKFEVNEVPRFSETLKIEHNLGFVQGTWFCNGHRNPQDFDGNSIIVDYLPLYDDISYHQSAQSTILLGNMCPVIVGSGIDANDATILTESPRSLWAIPEKAKMEYLQTKLEGVKEGAQYMMNMQNVLGALSGIPTATSEHKARVPSSGQALRILMEGLIVLIKRLRTTISPQIVELITKITCLHNNGEDVIGDKNVHLGWYEVIEDTSDDIFKKAQAAVQLVQSKVISRQTMTKYFADDYGIENIDEELKRLEEEAKSDVEVENNKASFQASLENQGDNPDGNT